MALIHEEEPRISFYFKRFYYIQVMKENSQSNFITDFLTIFKYVINSTFLIFHTEMHSYIYSILTLTVKPILMLCYSKGGSRLPCWSYQGSASKISWLCKPLFSKSSLMRCSMLMPPHTASSVHITISWKFYTSRSQLLIHFWESTSQIWFRRKGLSNFFEAY